MAEESALAPLFPILFTLILQMVVINHINVCIFPTYSAYYNSCSLVIDLKAEDRAIVLSSPILFLLRLQFFSFNHCGMLTS